MKKALMTLVMGIFGLAPRPVQGAMWVSAYYVAWRQDHLKPEEIDFRAMTHLMHFGARPRPDGTLDLRRLDLRNVSATVSAAHRADRKVLLTIGGQASRADFEAAWKRPQRRQFVENIVGFMREHGYDGVDIDMEDIAPEDEADYARFIRALRRRLDAYKPRPLLTAAVRWRPALFARLADQFDQLNVMTYDLSGPYPGWITWHNSPLFDGGYRFPNARRSLPSVDGLLSSFIAAGAPPEKLAIGLCFYGFVWSGSNLSRPGQLWVFPPSVEDVPYYILADRYHIQEYDYTNPWYRWDNKARAPYLSVERLDDSQFVSYDNEVSLREKIRYARGKGIGGVFIWELTGGYRADLSPGRRDALLQVVKQSALLR